jgi:uracil-DNA glycosylase family 4
MRWTERQRAMLEEMGLRLWLPEAAALVEEGAALVSPRAVASPGAIVSPVAAQAAVAPTSIPRLDASAFAALDLPALATRAAACTDCALCASRRHAVLDATPAEADWMVVVDAPGEDEDASGEPFAGPAGQLLDNMLAAMRLGRREAARVRRVHATHAVKCRPAGGRAPEPGEVARCAPYLRRQIELVKPRVVLAMGRAAALSLLGDVEPLGRLRGRPHAREGHAVIVTYAPAHLLRHAEDKAAAWTDLCLALETMRAAGPERGA